MKKLFENWRAHLRESPLIIPEKYRGIIFYNNRLKTFLACHPDGDHFVNSNDDEVMCELKDRIYPLFKEDIDYRSNSLGINKWQQWLSDYEIVYDLKYINDFLGPTLSGFPQSIQDLLNNKEKEYYDFDIINYKMICKNYSNCAPYHFLELNLKKNQFHVDGLIWISDNNVIPIDWNWQPNEWYVGNQIDFTIKKNGFKINIEEYEPILRKLGIYMGAFDI